MPTKPERRDPDVPLATYGRGRTVRLGGHDYASDRPVHFTVCAPNGRPFENPQLAALVCHSIERTAELLVFRLYAYCLMPDHLHVLVSPADSQRPAAGFLHRFKSFTTCEYRKMTGQARPWQTTAYDRVLRPPENAVAAAAYLANKPVRAGLVACWQEWPYTRVFVE